MSGVKTKGIVIKQTDFGEGDRMLSIFTEDFGIVKAVGRGARRLKSRSGSSGQFLCYGEFDFFCGGEIWNINSFSPSESFEGIQYDIKTLALCTYIAELTYALLEYNNPDKIMLRLLLNTLFVCAYKKFDRRLVKLVFELKALSLGGFCPASKACVSCGSSEITAFDCELGGVVCRGCERAASIKISEPSCIALRYILSCDIKKMFSYSFPEEVICELSYISERYVSRQLDKEIKSLSYYKML